MAKKANQSAWIFGAIVLIILGAVGWKYFGSEITGSKAGTGGDVVYVNRDDNFLSNITIGGTAKQLDSRWKFAYVSDDTKTVGKKVLLSGVTFSGGNYYKAVDKAYIRVYVDSANKNPIIATAIPGRDDRLPFLLKPSLPIANGSNVRLEVLYDLKVVDGSVVKNDTGYWTRIVSPKDVIVSAPNPTPIEVRLDQSNRTANYLFKTKPMFGLASTSPTGALIPGKHMNAAEFKVTANSAGDLALHTIRVSADTNLNDVNNVGDDRITLVRKSTAVTLGQSSGLDFAVGTNSAFVDISLDVPLMVAAGTTEIIQVFVDTSDFEDVGDSIRMWLDDNRMWNIGWESLGMHDYAHAEIIFRGDILGNILVKA